MHQSIPACDVYWTRDPPHHVGVTAPTTYIKRYLLACRYSVQNEVTGRLNNHWADVVNAQIFNNVFGSIGRLWNFGFGLGSGFQNQKPGFWIRDRHWNIQKSARSALLVFHCSVLSWWQSSFYFRFPKLWCFP